MRFVWTGYVYAGFYFDGWELVMDIVAVKSLFMGIGPILVLIIAYNWFRFGAKHAACLTTILLISVVIGIGFGNWMIFSFEYFK